MKKLDDLLKSIKELNPRPLQLTKQEYIHDAQKFLTSHESILKANSGNRTFLPYYTRLEKYYECLKRLD